MSDALLGTICRSLAAAVKQRSPFTLMQLATVGEDGAPKLRTIVLRRFDEETGSLSFIADLRSPKVREIKANPLVSLAAFDGGNAVQLRIDGRAENHRGRNAEARFLELATRAHAYPVPVALGAGHCACLSPRCGIRECRSRGGLCAVLFDRDCPDASGMARSFFGATHAMQLQAWHRGLGGNLGRALIEGK